MPEHQGAVGLLAEVGEAVEQEPAARIAGRPPEAVVEHEQRQDGAVRSGGIDRGEQRGVVGEPQIAAEPQHGRRHGVERKKIARESRALGLEIDSGRYARTPPAATARTHTDRGRRTDR